MGITQGTYQLRVQQWNLKPEGDGQGPLQTDVEIEITVGEP
jgi:hypothetical protein